MLVATNPTAARTRSWAFPAGLLCLGGTLLFIAGTIVLSLIPTFLSKHGADLNSVTQTRTLIFQLINNDVLPVGVLNANQIAIVQNYLQNALNSNPSTKGTSIQVISAIARLTQTKKRQAVTYAQFLNTVAQLKCALPICNGPDTNVLKTIVFTVDTLNAIAAKANSTSTTNQTRILVRRSANREDSVHPGKVYVDLHRMVGSQGYVNTVSFYADRTCASAEVTFAAFDLLSRNLDYSVQLVAEQQSGPLKLGAASQLKPFMNLITIRLCTGNPVWDNSNDGCQGKHFAVLPHQYIGIYSDTCRFGFARTPSNSFDKTTFVHSGGSNPLAEPYKDAVYIPANYTVLQSFTVATSEDRSIQKLDSKETKHPRVLFVGSYTPRRCGLAKFLKNLVDSYEGSSNVVAVDEPGLDLATRNYSDNVVLRLRQNERNDYFTAAELANSQSYDVINVQHEYGIYGGMSGEYIVGFLAALRKPVFVTMHTVLPNPNTFDLVLTRAIAATSTGLIVLSPIGRRLLIDVYDIDESKIFIARHGVPDVSFTPRLDRKKMQLNLPSERLIMVTFGLLHRDKNIELVLNAMHTAVQQAPQLLYLIIGQTHPVIRQREGDAYINQLKSNITALDLNNNVRFINEYLNDQELISYLTASDIYITPYVHEEQYVSGTLSWAVGMGMVVVSTPYVYARELLSDGRGFLFPFGDAQALSSILVNLAEDEEMRNAARHKAYRYGRRMIWSNVAHELEELFRTTLFSI